MGLFNVNAGILFLRITFSHSEASSRRCNTRGTSGTFETEGSFYEQRDKEYRDSYSG